MAIKTPSYWKEEKYQPLVEAETAYGNIVEIPQNLQDIWKRTASLKGKYPKDVEQAKAVGFFERKTRNRENWDILLVYYEEFQEQFQVANIQYEKDTRDHVPCVQYNK